MITPDSKAVSCRNVAEPLDVTNARRDRDYQEHGVILFRCDETNGHSPSSRVVVDEHGLALCDGQGKTDIVGVGDFCVPELNAL